MAANLSIFKTTPVWDKDTFPFEFRVKNSGKEDEWENPTVLLGKLTYYEMDEEGNVTRTETLEPGEYNFLVEPGTPHRYEAATDDMMMQFNFLCETKKYFKKKHDLGIAHSEVVEAVEKHGVAPGKTLDLGCGHGRNALYLSLLEHDVTAVDTNTEGIQKINEIAEEELLEIDAHEYDINRAALKSYYDFITSTVTLMFLDPEKVPDIINNMQEQTKPGGCNLIVSAMSTEENPSPLNFPFTFSEGELSEYYKDWEIIKYNEDLGHLHKKDEEGNPIQLQFATLLARKPE